MTSSDQPETGTAIDFDAVYSQQRVRPEVGGLPWDIGVVQPAVVELEGLGRFRGEVLDVGCGLGNNSTFLADHGYRTTGLDSVPAAVEVARARAGNRDLTFAVADAADLDGYDARFDSVLHSMLFHSLAPAVRARHALALHRATRPGALLSLLTFTDAMRGTVASLAVPEAELRTTLGDAGWNITDLDRTTFVIVAAPMLATLQNSGLPVEVDENGWTRVPVWRVLAERSQPGRTSST